MMLVYFKKRNFNSLLYEIQNAAMNYNSGTGSLSFTSGTNNGALNPSNNWNDERSDLGFI